MVMAAVRPEAAGLATAEGPADGRALEMQRALRRLVDPDGARVSVLVGGEDVPLESTGIGSDMEQYLSEPLTAREIERTGTDRRPPTPAQRRSLTRTTGLRIVDPMASVTAVGRLVDGPFAGVVLGDDGAVTPLPGLPEAEDDLLGARSGLLDAVRRQPTSGASPTAFLWPYDRRGAPHGHVRVTTFTFAAGAVPGVHGIVLLSPPPDLCGLTRRELEVLGHMLDGSSNDQIARALVVTPRTVATHVEHILLKLASPSRTHAAVRAQREGLYVAASAPSC